MKKKVIAISLVFLWVMVIYWFSSKNGDESSMMSQNFLLSFLIEGKSKEQIEQIHFLIRKIAHVTEYFILSGLVLNMFKTFGMEEIKNKGYSLCLVVLLAAFDEYHQTFVPGRGGCIRDVCIDSIGFLLLMVVILAAKGLNISMIRNFRYKKLKG